MRDKIECMELLEVGINESVEADTLAIIKAATRNLGRTVKDEYSLYGGVAAEKIVKVLSTDILG